MSTKKKQMASLAAIVLVFAAGYWTRDANQDGEGGIPALGDVVTASPGTIQSEMTADLGRVRDKYVRLAKAIPAESYSWRPAQGVRSVSEVFMHVVATNFGIIASVLGEAPPEDVAPTWYDFRNAESITDKETIVRAVGASFDYVARITGEASDERLDEAVEMFGRNTTVRDVLLGIVTHTHEHLGQSIAYARSNGVTPPWSQASAGE